MEKKELNDIEKKYQENPNQLGNIFRYTLYLISCDRVDEALKILKDVDGKDKQNIVTLYFAKAYKAKNDEEKFMFYINQLLTSDISNQAYQEIAEYYLAKAVKLKKKIKAEKQLDKKGPTEAVQNFITLARENFDKSLEIKEFQTVLYSYGNLEYFENNYEKAKYFYEKLLGKENIKLKLNEMFFLKLRLATIYYYEDKLDKATILLNELFDSNYKYKKDVKILFANIKLKEGKYEEAYHIFKSAVKDNNATTEDYFEFAKLCLKVMEYDDAEIYLAKCKNSYLHPRVLQEEAKMNVALGNHDKAKEIYSLLLNGSEKDKNIAYLGLGLIERINNNYDDALNWLKKALYGTLKDQILACIEIGKVYDGKGDLDLSEENFYKATELSNSEYGLLELARIYIKRDNFVKGKEILTNILNTNTNKHDRSEAILSLANIYKLNRMYKEAEECVQEILVNKNKIYFKALCLIIECSLEQKDYDKAIKNITLLQTSRNYIDKEKCIFFLGELARFKGNFDEAERYYWQIEHFDQALFSLGQLYNAKDDVKFKEVINRLKKRSSLGVNMANYLLALNHIHYGYLDEAVSCLKENIVKHNNFTCVSLMLIGQIEEFNGRNINAIEYYKKVQDLKTKYYLKAIYKIGKLYLKEGKLELSKEYFNEILKAEGKYRNLTEINLAIIASEEGRFKEAEELLSKFNGALDESYAKFELAKSKLRQKKYIEARNIFKSLLNCSNRVYVLLELTRVESLLTNYDQALYYANLLYEEGNTRDQKLSLVEQARILVKQNNLEEAKKIYLILIKQDVLVKGNDDIISDQIDDDKKIEYDYINFTLYNELLIELGRIEKKLGNLDNATFYLSKVKTEKETIFAKYEMIDIFLEKKDYDQALKNIAILENTFLSDNAKTKKLKIHFALNNYQEVHKTCKMIKDKDFSDVIFYNEALAYYLEEQFEKSQKYFSYLVKPGNKYREYALYYLGKIAIFKKDYKLAHNYFKKCYNAGLQDLALKELIGLDIHHNNLKEAYFKMDELHNLESDQGCENNSFTWNYLSYELNVLLDYEYYGDITQEKNNIYDSNEYNIKSKIVSNSQNFNSDIDIGLILDNIEFRLTEETFIRNNVYDEYILEVPNIGVNGENYLKVVTVPNTLNIIEVYPVLTKYNCQSDYIRKKAR